MFKLVRDLINAYGTVEPDRRPVLARTQERASFRLRHAAWLLEKMADTVDADPRNDAMVDWLDAALGQALLLAGQALGTFRSTRDCAE